MTKRMPSGHFYGEKFKSAEIAGILLTEYRYPPRFVIPRHWHQSPYIAFVLRGAYTESRGLLRQRCGPSSVLYQPAGDVHAEQHEAAVVRIFSLQLTPQFLKRISDYAVLPSRPRMIRTQELATLGYKLYREFRVCDPLASLAAEAYALESLVSLCRHRQPKSTDKPRWVLTVRDLLHEHFPDVPSLTWIGEQVNIHPAHLSRAFRHHFRCTIGEYARRLRIERAQEFLRNSDCALSDIAALVGYSEQSHFSTIFKRYTGSSPGAYRKLMR